MLFVLSLLAALLCAICYGVSSVLQKSGADKEKRAASLNPGLLVRLLHRIPYVVGTGLDLAVWPLTVFAVQNLPLFVVQPIISFSVVVTVAVEWIFYRRRLNKQTLAAIACVLAGLIIIATQAGLENARSVSHTSLWAICLAGPAVIIIAGAYFARLQRGGAFGLALCAGSAFGMDSVGGRILPIAHPLWQTIYQPVLWAMAAYGIIAMLLFSLALQRARASVVNATVVGMETVLPAVLGIWLLGDTPRGDTFGPMIAGAGLTLAGTVVVALLQPEKVRAQNIR